MSQEFVSAYYVLPRIQNKRKNVQAIVKKINL